MYKLVRPMIVNDDGIIMVKWRKKLTIKWFSLQINCFSLWKENWNIVILLTFGWIKRYIITHYYCKLITVRQNNMYSLMHFVITVVKELGNINIILYLCYNSNAILKPLNNNYYQILHTPTIRRLYILKRRVCANAV